MLTFAITTTTKLAGISLHRNNKMLGEIRIEVSKTHSTTILDQIDSHFTWTGEKLDNVKNVLVSIGPGSFTGVRTAISGECWFDGGGVPVVDKLQNSNLFPVHRRQNHVLR